MLRYFGSSSLSKSKKDNKSLKYFIQRSQVLKLYRALLKATISDSTVRNEIKNRFLLSSKLENKKEIKKRIQEGEEVLALISRAKPSNNTTPGTLGKGWPWEKNKQ